MPQIAPNAVEVIVNSCKLPDGGMGYRVTEMRRNSANDEWRKHSHTLQPTSGKADVAAMNMTASLRRHGFPVRCYLANGREY